MVQGPYLNIEHSPKMAKTWENNKKNAKNIHCYCNVEETLLRVQGPYPNIENVVTLGDVIWLAFILVETLVKVYDYFEEVSNFFQYFVFFSIRNDLCDIIFIYL